MERHTRVLLVVVEVVEGPAGTPCIHQLNPAAAKFPGAALALSLTLIWLTICVRPRLLQCHHTLDTRAHLTRNPQVTTRASVHHHLDSARTRWCHTTIAIGTAPAVGHTMTSGTTRILHHHLAGNANPEKGRTLQMTSMDLSQCMRPPTIRNTHLLQATCGELEHTLDRHATHAVRGTVQMSLAACGVFLSTIALSNSSSAVFCLFTGR